MTRHLPLTAALLTAGALATGVVVALSGPAGAAPARKAPSTAHTVTLPTGDRFTVTPDSYYPTPGSGPGGPMARFTSPDGHRHVVPGGLSRYLGAGLDPALFDLDALAAAETDGKLPVSLTFAPGTQPTAPAGVTVTSVTGSTATGFLTSGAAFTDALRRGGPDHAAAGLRSVGLTGVVRAPVVQPRYPLHTLEIDAIDKTGAPASALVVLFNTDDLAKQDMTFVPVVDGIGKVAVPAGHYMALGDIDDLAADGRPLAMHIMSVDTTVTDAPLSKLTVDARTATAKLSVSTPKPATQAMVDVYMHVGDARGKAETFGFGVIGDDSLPMYLAPRAKPAVGTLHTLTDWHGFAGTDPNASDPAYRYDVAFNSDNGIAADQHLVVRPEELATVHARFAADPAYTDQDMLQLSVIDDSNVADAGHDALGWPVPPAGVATEYLGTAHGGRWILTGYAGVAGYDGELSTFRGGREYTVDYGHGALAPSAGTHTGTQPCIACAAGGTLTFGLHSTGDSQHSGDVWVSLDNAHFTLSRNGTTLADETGISGVVLPSVPEGPAVYHSTFDVDLSGVDGVTLSTATHTELTVPFDPAKAATLPDNDGCEGESAGTPCRILPLPTLRYDLPGTDLHNTTTSPVQVLHLEAGHLSYDGAGSTARFTSVKVSVSFDGGKTWRAAPVAGAAGHYVATWPNNAPAGTKPALQVTATDADGGAITQTIANAYQIGARS
ncbi:hypothetical protein [Labedaea rhizosphaerae]|uniref:Uncharacterized protein n=1 Tax=Labedaea rhizosphaerae TaxID=598644 RepID=A0A4R6S782_LABRH|nr:hypothetical protein [Labedaea rhizosphaerae]TDP95087.1 hypothetical protein EV186_105319 [Labedaea rhizosphaerae]